MKTLRKKVPAKKKKPIKATKKKTKLTKPKKVISRKVKKISALIETAVENKESTDLSFINEYHEKSMASHYERLKASYDARYERLKANFRRRKIKCPPKAPWTPPKNDTISFLQFEPSCRTILVEQYDIFSCENVVTPYYLSLPYIQFYKRGGSLYVTCSQKRIQSLKDSVCFLPLPNAGYDIFEDICLGSNKETTIEKAASRYFTSSFNNGRGEEVCFPREVKHYRNWDKQTRLNNNFWKTVAWADQCDLKEFLDNICGNDGDY
jgi:hypothetical protein